MSESDGSSFGGRSALSVWAENRPKEAIDRITAERDQALADKLALTERIEQLEASTWHKLAQEEGIRLRHTITRLREEMYLKDVEITGLKCDQNVAITHLEEWEQAIGLPLARVIEMAHERIEAGGEYALYGDGDLKLVALIDADGVRWDRIGQGAYANPKFPEFTPDREEIERSGGPVTEVWE